MRSSFKDAGANDSTYSDGRLVLFMNGYQAITAGHASGMLKGHKVRLKVSEPGKGSNVMKND